MPLQCQSSPSLPTGRVPAAQRASHADLMYLSSAPPFAPLCAAVIPLFCSCLPPKGPSWTLLANSQAHVGPPAPFKPSTPIPQPLSLRYPLPLALLPGHAGGAVERRSESAAPTPAPLPLLLSNTRQGFFPFLPGSEWAHSLWEPRPLSNLLPGGLEF